MSNWRPIGEDAWHLPLSLEEGRRSPTGRSPGSGSLPLNSFPRPRPQWISSTAPRLQWRVRAGFTPASLFSSLRATWRRLTCRGAWPASPPPKG